MVDDKKLLNEARKALVNPEEALAKKDRPSRTNSREATTERDRSSSPMKAVLGVVVGLGLLIAGFLLGRSSPPEEEIKKEVNPLEGKHQPKDPGKPEKIQNPGKTQEEEKSSEVTESEWRKISLDKKHQVIHIGKELAALPPLLFSEKTHDGKVDALSTRNIGVSSGDVFIIDARGLRSHKVEDRDKRINITLEYESGNKVKFSLEKGVNVENCVFYHSNGRASNPAVLDSLLKNGISDEKGWGSALDLGIGKEKEMQDLLKNGTRKQGAQKQWLNTAIEKGKETVNQLDREGKEGRGR